MHCRPGDLLQCSVLVDVNVNLLELFMSCEFIVGGARSGKSRHAEQAAAASGLAVHVIATATVRISEREAAEIVSGPSLI